MVSTAIFRLVCAQSIKFFVISLLETNVLYVLPPLLCSSEIWCMHHATLRICIQLVIGNGVSCPNDSCQWVLLSSRRFRVSKQGRRAFQFTNCNNSMQCSLTLDFIDLLCNEMRGNRKEINYQCIDKVMNSGVTW